MDNIFVSISIFHQFSELIIVFFTDQSVIQSEEDSFVDSYRHSVQYTRENKTVHVILDNLIYLVPESNHVDFMLKKVSKFPENIIQVGSSRISGQNLSFADFKGCISSK